jgi:hypothetical protein
LLAGYKKWLFQKTTISGALTLAPVDSRVRKPA